MTDKAVDVPRIGVMRVLHVLRQRRSIYLTRRSTVARANTFGGCISTWSTLCLRSQSAGGNMCTPPWTTTLARFTRDRCRSSWGLQMPLIGSGQRQRMRWSRLRAVVTENARLESTRKGRTRIILNHGSRAIRRETHIREAYLIWHVNPSYP